MKIPEMAFAGLLLASLAVVGCGKKPVEAPKTVEQPKPTLPPQTTTAGATQPSTAGTAPQPTATGEERPEAVWEAVKAANASRNHRAFIEGFSPASQKDMAARQAYHLLSVRDVDGGSEKRTAELRAEYKPIIDALDKHGLTAEATKSINTLAGRDLEDKNIEKLAALIKDPAGLWADLKTAYAKRPGKRDEPSTEFEGKLTNVKINGDKATAVLVQSGPDGVFKAPVVFIKVSGKWKLAPELRPRN
jgi:hypothetical protein